MKSRKVAKGWTFYVGNTSGVLIETIYDANLYECILEKLSQQFDSAKPTCRKGIVDLRQELIPKLDIFIKDNTKLICEVPLVKGKIDLSVNDNKFTPYKVPEFSERIYKSVLLKGQSLSNKTFRNMRNNIRNELHSRNTSVLCEVYDRQFHDIIVNSDEGKPLTRLQHVKQHFKNVLDNNNKKDLLDALLPYSEITSVDKDELNNLPFKNGKIHTMESITVGMKRVLVDNDHFIREIHITTTEVNNYSMKDIVTNHRISLWNKYRCRCRYQTESTGTN